MFEDENRPLYKLCWKLTLNRIATKHYQSHIQKAAKQAWGEHLTEECVTTIFHLTERHPYYLNKLCDRIWACFTARKPEETDVSDAWEKILEEEKSDAIREISLLSPGQKIVLLQIAKNSASQLTSKQALMDMQMTGSSVMAALDGLEEKDIIERDSEKYQIINPVVKYYVLKGSKSV